MKALIMGVFLFLVMRFVYNRNIHGGGILIGGKTDLH
ncbi:hypothetical protein SAMN05421737_10178 [Shouchella lonarensis]|uniref:Uncharacterized protein n=1 Tax=Shouchella lonarensis TaxID=1464122 RepID=A0A1G6GHN1_9BACI|nr:hypothetical protein SAMN05421737_10178 [Shouchella lonarensis]